MTRWYTYSLGDQFVHCGTQKDHGQESGRRALEIDQTSHVTLEDHQAFIQLPISTVCQYIYSLMQGLLVAGLSKS